MELFLITLFVFMSFTASSLSLAAMLNRPIKGSCGGINCRCKDGTNND